MALSEQTPSGAAARSATDPVDVVELDVVELTVPASTEFLGVVRTATAGMAARLSFSLDEIEDLRIAVDEACVILLSLPGPASSAPRMLSCRYRVLEDGLRVSVSAAVANNVVMPTGQSFAWQVLTAHTSAVSGEAADGVAEVRLDKRWRR